MLQAAFREWGVEGPILLQDAGPGTKRLTASSSPCGNAAMRRHVPIALVVWLAGCTAAKASIQIVNAEQSLSRAETQGAEDIAAYEYTMARLYLEKAREESGYSEFRIADALARQSAEWSDRAVIFVEKRGRTDINLDDFVLPEATAPDPAPKAAPTRAPKEDWLQESNPDTVPGEGPLAEEPEPEPDPFAIEEDDDEMELGDPAPEPEPKTNEGTIGDTGTPQ